MKTVGTAAPISALWTRRPSSLGADGTFRLGGAFVRWLAATGQGAWQFLPLTETHLEPGSRTVHVPSPYKGYGTGLDPRYLDPADLARAPSSSELAVFRRAHAAWLPDHALFCALRDRFGTDDWTRWPKPIRLRQASALRAWRHELHEAIEAHVLLQWRLHAALAAMRADARAAGVTLIGDLPFYLPLQSPLVWAHRRCFDLDADGRPRKLSGVPVNRNSFFGRQLWGHPVYRWSARSRRRELLALWKLRMTYAGRLYDLVRLDHAKGFFAYGALDPKDRRRDKLVAGPGAPVFKTLIAYARKIGLDVFAEDAGDRLKELQALLRELRIPGIRMLRFAYNEKWGRIEPDHADVRHYPPEAVAYTTTHDTVTLMQYLARLTEAQKRHLCAHLGVAYVRDRRRLAVRLRDAVIASPARFTVVPTQDWLLSSRRINVPGTERPKGDRNWRYRVKLPVERLPKSL